MWLVLEFGLCLGVYDIKVHVVVVQLIEDVERGIVAHIVLIGVECA